MIEYIKITIKKTSKPIGSKKENYEIFNVIEHLAKDKKEAREYLNGEYGKCKREKMYIDDEQNNPKQIGWIYSFKNQDISHNSDYWWQKDWVSITRVKEKEIMI